MIEPYNMTQEQRDAAHISSLERQNADLIAVVKILAEKRIGVQFQCDELTLTQNIGLKELLERSADGCAATAALKVLEGIHNFGELYEKLAHYEQWFYYHNRGGRSMR